MTAALPALLDLVLPQACAGCAAPGLRWCPSCAADLAGWRDTPRGRVAPTPVPAGFPRCTSAAPYDGVVRQALLAYKDRGGRWLAEPLGGLLATAVLELGCGDVVLVPVPSTRAAVRRRGYDHALRLARAAAQEVAAAGGRARVLPGLAPRRRLADQSGLTAPQRAANLAGALQLPARAATLLRGMRCPVVVVDDVVTTGVTLAEAHRALVRGGVPVLGAATVAATQRGTDATVRRRSRD